MAAHLDTVFPPGTDVRVRVEGTRAYAPGIRDNSAAVAILLQVAAAWKDAPLTLPYRLLFAANVGEEGLGDLRGIRHLVENLRPDAVVAFDGRLGAIVHEAVGSRRVKATYRGPGGHSFGDFIAIAHGLGLYLELENPFLTWTDPQQAIKGNTNSPILLLLYLILVGAMALLMYLTHALSLPLLPVFTLLLVLATAGGYRYLLRRAAEAYARLGG
ncbi:MAG: M20/M25/M40 family metallo-hydrolase [Clostridiales bacterium]|nr:M20/M25/M40 family metallo-hydrolase [Clostridiales bacterium]